MTPTFLPIAYVSAGSVRTNTASRGGSAAHRGAHRLPGVLSPAGSPAKETGYA
ncbi:hypothetical protein [Nonomuraea sp. NPDC049028]|uniref:hypothetical protein n=1 Tax=Nonomuraea sp. NPDC049028 TaxID=3364348 RepID=UPI0037249B8C